MAPREKTLDLICKLVMLSDPARNPYQDEVNSARRKVRQLMGKYKVSVDELKAFARRREGTRPVMPRRPQPRPMHAQFVWEAPSATNTMFTFNRSSVDARIHITFGTV